MVAGSPWPTLGGGFELMTGRGGVLYGTRLHDERVILTAWLFPLAAVEVLLAGDGTGEFDVRRLMIRAA